MITAILKELDRLGNLKQIVTIDGESRSVDLSEFNLRSVVWDGASGVVQTQDLAEIAITDFAPFQIYVDRWHALTIEPVVLPLTLEQTIELFKAQIQEHLDSEARAVNYDSIISACSYAAAPNPFQEEAITFVVWRGAVWEYCYAELDKVINGTRPMPTVEEIISELPSRL